MHRGMFITFEGGEGSGKSTQARRLAETLRARGIETLLTREPGGSPFAEAVRSLLLDPSTPPHGPLSEALLFYAARADHIAQLICPALDKGAWVISDRFSDSTRVYQGHGGKLPVATLDALEAIAVAECHPQLTFIIDIPAELGLQRAAARRLDKAAASNRPGAPDAPDAYEGRDLAFHEKLREGFLAIARQHPRRCVLMDGTASEDELAERIDEAVKTRLAGKLS